MKSTQSSRTIDAESFDQKDDLTRSIEVNTEISNFKESASYDQQFHNANGCSVAVPVAEEHSNDHKMHQQATSIDEEIASNALFDGMGDFRKINEVKKQAESKPESYIPNERKIFEYSQEVEHSISDFKRSSGGQLTQSGDQARYRIPHPERSPQLNQIELIEAKNRDQIIRNSGSRIVARQPRNKDSASVASLDDMMESKRKEKEHRMALLAGYSSVHSQATKISNKQSRKSDPALINTYGNIARSHASLDRDPKVTATNPEIISEAKVSYASNGNEIGQMIESKYREHHIGPQFSELKQTAVKRPPARFGGSMEVSYRKNRDTQASDEVQNKLKRNVDHVDKLIENKANEFSDSDISLSGTVTDYISKEKRLERERGPQVVEGSFFGARHPGRKKMHESLDRSTAHKNPDKASIPGASLQRSMLNDSESNKTQSVASAKQRERDRGPQMSNLDAVGIVRRPAYHNNNFDASSSERTVAFFPNESSKRTASRSLDSHSETNVFAQMTCIEKSNDGAGSGMSCGKTGRSGDGKEARNSPSTVVTEVLTDSFSCSLKQDILVVKQRERDAGPCLLEAASLVLRRPPHSMCTERSNSSCRSSSSDRNNSQSRVFSNYEDTEHKTTRSRKTQESLTLTMQQERDSGLQNRGAAVGASNVASTTKSVKPSAIMERKITQLSTYYPEQTSKQDATCRTAYANSMINREKAKLEEQSSGPVIATLTSNPSATCRNLYANSVIIREKAKINDRISGPELPTNSSKPYASSAVSSSIVDREKAKLEDQTHGPTLASPYQSSQLLSHDNLSVRSGIPPQAPSFNNEANNRHFSSINNLSINDAHPDYATGNSLEFHRDADEQLSRQESGYLVEEGFPMFPGAYAINGVGVRDDESSGSDVDPDFDNLSNDSCRNSMNDTSLLVEENIEHPSAHEDLLEGNVLDAALHEELIVDGAIILPSDDDEILLDIKTLRRVRLVQIASICFCAVAIIFICITIVGGFSEDQTPDEIVPSAVVGWLRVGNIFGPDDQPHVLFGSQVVLSKSGLRMAVLAPGVDINRTLNVGALFLLEQLKGRNGTEWKTVEILNGTTTNLGPQMSLSGSGDLSTVVVGFPRFDGGGQIQIFQENKDKWSITPSPITVNRTFHSNSSGETWFGYSVAMSTDGTILAVGAPLSEGDNGNRVGAVYVYKKIDSALGAWELLAEPVTGKNADEYFGYCVKISKSSLGTRLVVGAPMFEETRGLVRIYDLIDSEWIQSGNDLAGIDGFARFGESLSLSEDGTVLVVGGRGNAFNPGMVKVYRKVDEEWISSPTGGNIIGLGAGEGFGSAVSISDDGRVIAVGAPENNLYGFESGTIRVYQYREDTDVWIEKGKNIGHESIYNFGASVSMSADGSTIAGGAPLTAFADSVPRVGCVHVYSTDGVFE